MRFTRIYYTPFHASTLLLDQGQAGKPDALLSSSFIDDGHYHSIYRKMKNRNLISGIHN